MPENLSSEFTNNKGANKPVNFCRLISPFVSYLNLLRVKFQFSSKFLQLRRQVWVSLSFVVNPEERFCRIEAQISL